MIRIMAHWVLFWVSLWIKSTCKRLTIGVHVYVYTQYFCIGTYIFVYMYT